MNVQKKMKNEMKMKKAPRHRRKHCALAVIRRSQKISPRCRNCSAFGVLRECAIQIYFYLLTYLLTDPLPGGAGRPKFNQLEMVTTFTYSLVKIDARNYKLL